MVAISLRPAARAFDAVASHFDARFGAWQSVAAQRRAVRSELLQRFPAGGTILEVGGGTGEDGVFLAERGFHVLSTDPSPTMVAGEKNEELLLAIIDLLLDAVGTEGGVDPIPDRRTEDAR